MAQLKRWSKIPKKKNYCIDCKKEIKNKYAKRCRSCSGKNNRGENHPNWLGGISKRVYSFAFNRVLKKLIKTRDNYTCQNCGMTEEEYFKIKKRAITVHHIDYDKMNCNENNLITLCLKCNNKANFNREYWKQFYKNKLENKACFL